MKAEGRVGAISGNSGSVNPLRTDARGQLAVALSGDYKDATLAGNQYFAYCGVQDVALYTATSAIGMIVYNPTGSGVNLVWNKWNVMVSITSAAMTGMVLAISAQAATPGTTTAATLTGKSLLTGSTGLSTGSAIAYSVATITTAPVVFCPLFQDAVAAASLGGFVTNGDLQGAFASAPGTVTVMGAFAAAGVDVDMTLCWEEVPV